LPELPEVETIRRQLSPLIGGRKISDCALLDPRWCLGDSPARVERGVRGRRIELLYRRGKYLILKLDGAHSLVMHLRMTGNLILSPPQIERPPYLRAWFEIESAGELQFTDRRRLGHGALLRETALAPYLDSRLGIEPLSPEFTAEALERLSSNRKAPLKSFLLAQDRVAGIGNIYADEALFRARLHPQSPAGSMRGEHCEDLREGIVDALLSGLDRGGASVDAYRDARGGRGSMQDEFLVHRREGVPCPRCGELIRRIMVSGRSTYFCPGCQRRLRRRRRRRTGSSGKATRPPMALV
jgi:formamidopyrimidine-DNA glycosylase